MTEVGAGVPSFDQLDRQTLHERVYQEMKAAIVAGRLAPGQRLTVRSLARAFGTSPMPIREALRRLAQQQAVEIAVSGSVSLPLMTRERFRELTRIRVALEGPATEWATATITPDEIELLAVTSDEMWEACSRSDLDGYLAANTKFHFTIYHATRTHALVPLIEGLWMQVGPFLRFALTDMGISFAREHHLDAVTALRARDANAARRAIEADLSDAADHLLSTGILDD
jgi:DNA-binding GntR family transcriptional regulator